MTLMEPRRVGISNRAIAAIIAGSFLLIVAGLALSVRSTANRAWAAMELRTRELIAEARARPSVRPVLRGTAEPGNAWTDYEAAAPLMAAVRSKRMTVIAFVTRRPESDRAAVEKLVAANGSVIDHMRRGTRRSEVSFPYAWERGGSLETPPLLVLQDLGMLAVSRARLMKEGGRHRESLETLLDVAQFGGDLRRNGVLIADMVGCGVLFMALDELRDLLASSPLSAVDLAQVDRELEILDRDWPDFGSTLRNEGMAMQASLLASDRRYPADDPFFAETWRYGFSRRLMIADAGARSGRLLERSAEQESMSWAERMKAGEESEREVREGANKLASSLSSGGLAASASVRLRRAQLRLLRIATRFRLDGTVVEWDDPFGQKILTRRTGGQLKAWSRGKDGVDHGGKGEWNSDKSGADIVLEVSK